MVAKGFKQKEGIDYSNTYSPTVQADSLRITIAKAARYNWNLKKLDIKAAYLNAKLKEKIYMKIPKGDKIIIKANIGFRHSEHPKELDLKSTYMILQYLNSTKEKSIHY